MEEALFQPSARRELLVVCRESEGGCRLRKPLFRVCAARRGPSCGAGAGALHCICDSICRLGMKCCESTREFSAASVLCACASRRSQLFLRERRRTTCCHEMHDAAGGETSGSMLSRTRDDAGREMVERRWVAAHVDEDDDDEDCDAAHAEHDLGVLPPHGVLQLRR
eukprot:3616984-Rhodomonas_salina.1